MNFTAWDALVYGQEFIWYVLLAILITGFAFGAFRTAAWDLLGELQNSLLEKLKQAQQAFQPKIEYSHDPLKAAKEHFRITVFKLKNDPDWQAGKSNELLMTALAVRLLRSFSGPDLGEPANSREFLEKISAESPFRKISGWEAQCHANQDAFAVAVHCNPDPGQPGAVACVIPGVIFPGTPYGQNNPMILWLMSSEWVELQAVMAFGAQHPPEYFGYYPEG